MSHMLHRVCFIIFSGPGPTFRTILSFLSDSTSLLESTIAQTATLTHRLNNWAKIGRDEVAEVS